MSPAAITREVVALLPRVESPRCEYHQASGLVTFACRLAGSHRCVTVPAYVERYAWPVIRVQRSLAEMAAKIVAELMG